MVMNSYRNKNIASIESTHILLFLILLFSCVTRFYRLSVPEQEYFDEVYHAFTAQKMYEGDQKAWEWWNSAPEGFAYEWSHPPLAKIVMACSMIIFGKNSFGWRLPEAIIGTLIILLVYLLAAVLFDDKTIALIAAGVCSLDGLLLTMSRIGKDDIYIPFFVLLTLYLFCINKNFLSSLALGLGIASKWSTILIFPVLICAYFVLKKKVRFSYILFVIVPPLIYLGAYFPLFLYGHNFMQFIELQKTMLNFHWTLDAGHAYSSPSWTWPFLIRPIYFYVNVVTTNSIATIYAMGNPLIFWSGFLSILISMVYVIIKKNMNLMLVVFSYFIFFVPWSFSHRVMFLYLYLPSIPFMAIAMGFVLKRLHKIVLPFFIVNGLTFFYFLPHWIALEVPHWLHESYFWLTTWR
jgi:dolichyl-phosphate-mannose-protein mannosyltransferase